MMVKEEGGVVVEGEGGMRKGEKGKGEKGKESGENRDEERGYRLGRR